VSLELPGSCFIFIACLSAAVGIASAQVDYATATLQGTVFDPQDLTVTGAKITVVNEANGAMKIAVSTGDGYQIPALVPGTYRVEAEAPGFSKSVARDVVLSVGQLVTYDVHLEVGPESSTVDVTADIPLVQPDQTQQANIINSNQVENLPNITRNFVQSIYTIPGVVNSFAPALQSPGVGTGYQSSGFSIGGSNGRNNLVTIDGGENDYGSGTLRVTHVPIDSIQEFQVNRSAFGAEFGFTVGTAINMVTRSGSNQFHGSASGYFRDRATDAENYFNKLAGAGGKPFEQSAIFGATIGGPIRKNRLFFFTAPEYQKLDSATVQNIAGEQEFQGVSSQPNGYDPVSRTCPNQKTAQQEVTQNCYLNQLANAGGALGALGAGLLASPVFGDPFGDPILKALITPNDGTFDGIVSGPAGSGVRAIPGFNTPRGRYFNWVTRLDFVPGARDSLSIRFSLMHELDNVIPQPPYSGSEPQRDYTLTGSWTRVYGPNVVNTVRVQAVPSNTFSTHAPAPNGSEIDLGSQIRVGTPFSYPYDAQWRRFQFDDSLSWVKGSHSFKFGASWRPDYYSVRQEVWFGGQWQFNDGTFSILNIVGAQNAAAASALASYNVSQGYPASGPASTNLTAVQAFLAGTPTILFQANPSSNPQWAAWANSLGLYAQDSWKISPRLTLNYGMRVDHNHDPSPVPSSTWVTPRVGLAWDPGGNGKTVIRGGGGIFVAPGVFMVPFYTNTLGISGKYVNQSALVAGLPSPPYPSIFAAWALQSSNATTAIPNPSLTNEQLASLGVVIGPPGPNAFGNIVFTMAPNYKPEYTIQASVSVAREIFHNYTLEVGYLMYRSVHVEQVLETNFVRNTAVPIDPFVGPQYMPRPGTTAGEPNSSIFQNGAFSSVGTGLYNGGTVSLTRRFVQGFQFQINYTLSRAVDDTNDFSSLSAPFRPDLLNLDWALSDFNITHNFVANAVYTTPFHPGSGGFISRVLADVTISPIFYARSGVPFTLLAPGLSNGTIGYNANARPWYEGRNNGLGPAFISWDLRLSKTLIRPGEHRPRLDLIAQAQNLLNRTNFAAVNNNFPADPNFPLPGGGTLQNGPFNVKGFAPASVSQLSDPLSFTSAFPARQISLALRLAF
jgi:Carboxypeptidase regulatory-like domain/TonB dependent receptor